MFDRKQEYDLPGALYAYTLPEAADAFCARRWQPFRIVFRPRDPADYFALLELLMYTQDVEPHGPLVVIAEEFSAYSETYTIDPLFREAFNAGRHLRLSIVTVIQSDTDVHRVTRTNAEIIVTMAQNRLSVDMAKHFDWNQVARLRSLRDGWTAEPEQGLHFLASPDVDLYDEWCDVQGVLYRPIPEPLGASA